MKKIIIDIDGEDYSSLTEGAKALGVSVSALTQCLRGSQMCKGHTVRYFEGAQRHAGGAQRHAGGAQRHAGGEGRSAEDVVKLIARWYIKEWRGKPIDAEVMISLTNFIKEHWVD